MFGQHGRFCGPEISHLIKYLQGSCFKCIKCTNLKNLQSLCRNSFKATGIWPFNAAAVDHMLDPSAFFRDPGEGTPVEAEPAENAREEEGERQEEGEDEDPVEDLEMTGGQSFASQAIPSNTGGRETENGEAATGEDGSVVVVQDFANHVTPSQEAAGEVQRLQKVLKAPRGLAAPKRRVCVSKDFALGRIFTSTEMEALFVEQDAREKEAKREQEMKAIERQEKKRSREAETARKKAEAAARKAAKQVSAQRPPQMTDNTIPTLDSQPVAVQPHAASAVAEVAIEDVLTSTSNVEASLEAMVEGEEARTSEEAGKEMGAGPPRVTLVGDEMMKKDVSAPATVQLQEITVAQGRVGQPDQVAVDMGRECAALPQQLDEWTKARMRLFELEKEKGMKKKNCRLCSKSKQACGTKKSPKNCPRRTAIDDMMQGKAIDLQGLVEAINSLS